MKMKTTSLLVALAASTCLTSVALAETLTRVATVPVGGEITGMYIEGDDLFFNVQHPSSDLTTTFAKATVGVVSNVNFSGGEIAVPATDAEKSTIMSTLGEYQILVQEGDFGFMGRIDAADGSELLVSNDPDFNAYVPTSGNTGYLFTNWENRPGGMSRVALSRAADGAWSVDEADTKMLDFSSVQGTWVNCFGTLSPWGTPLTSEELYFDNTAEWNDTEYKYIDGVNDLATHLGFYPNPYRYGYIVEITDPAGSAAPIKLTALGRFSHENSVVMPDQKTVYLSDDGTDVVFYKFIADTAGDLSSGTLFAAKMDQLGESGADSATTGFQVSWIELAHGTNEKIEGWIANYDGITQDDFTAGGNNYITDEEVAEWALGEASDNRVAFLESRKAAVAKGATAEFRKMEGVNINLDSAADGSVPFMYMAMSSVEKGMSDEEGDIQVTENKCGIVYEMRLDSTYNVGSMVPVVSGGAYDGNNEANPCDVEGISNPDNVLVLENGDVLIGEDTGKHENNAMWIWSRS